MAEVQVETIEVPAGRMRWSAIFAGTVATLGVWALLYVLGLAAGLSAIDPGSPESVRSAGVGTGIWSVIVPLLALFAGGVVVARLDGSTDRTAGVLHGLVLWGFTTVVGLAVMGTMLGGLLGGVIRVGQAGAGAVSAVIGSDEPAQGMDLDEGALLGAINDRLQAQGTPTVRADQLRAALRDIAATSIRAGRFDRNMAISAITQNTALGPVDAEALAVLLEQRWSEFRSQRLNQVTTGALKVADKTGKVMWGVFAALLLGLVSAVVGALVGVPRSARRVRRTTVMHAGEVHP